jgi:hypothetical protein
MSSAPIRSIDLCDLAGYRGVRTWADHPDRGRNVMVRRRRGNGEQADERRDRPLRLYRERMRAGKHPASDDQCEHLLAAPARDVGSPVTCDDHRPEDGSVVHLRACLICDHVGCCDSSPPQHATAHATGTGHPVIQSAEPGETWRWCYRDELLG